MMDPDCTIQGVRKEVVVLEPLLLLMATIGWLVPLRLN